MLTLVSCIVRVSIQWVTVLIQPKYVPATGRDRSGGAGDCYWSTIKLQTSPSPTITSKGAPSDVVGGTLLLPSSFIVLMVEESRILQKMLFLAFTHPQYIASTLWSWCLGLSLSSLHFVPSILSVSDQTRSDAVWLWCVSGAVLKAWWNCSKHQYLMFASF